MLLERGEVIQFQLKSELKIERGEKKNIGLDLILASLRNVALLFASLHDALFVSLRILCRYKYRKIVCTCWFRDSGEERTFQSFFVFELSRLVIYLCFVYVAQNDHPADPGSAVPEPEEQCDSLGEASAQGTRLLRPRQASAQGEYDCLVPI